MAKSFRAWGAALAALMALVALIGVFGCGGGGGGDAGAGGGTLDIFMADAPPDTTITSVEVDIARVEAHIGSSWTTISSAPQTVDLLDLVVTPIKIASDTMPAGHYTQVRFVISQARVTDSTGTHIATVANGTVFINVDHDIAAGVTTALLMDFNVDRSLVKLGNGNYLLTPVVPTVVRTDAGTVTGIATDGTNPLSNVHVWAKYKAGTNYAIDWPVNLGNSLADGSFKIWALLPGTYSLEFSWTDGVTTKTATVNNVVVTANANTDVGSVPLS